MRRIGKSLSLVLLLVVSVTAAQGPSQLRPGFNLFSKQQDVQLGQELAAQVRKQMTIVNDPTLTYYVNEIGKRLARTPEARESGFPFSFQVVADTSINAFALPGGPMFINTGLLRAVDNEAQLAGVMGHEMSHVILRHGTNQASKAQFVQLPAALGSAMLRNSIVEQLAQLGANSVLLKFSRTAETQADLMGSHLMAHSGYDPVQMAKFFEKLNTGQQAPQFMLDHPNPANREKAIRVEAAKLPEQTFGFQTGDFQKMKKVVATIKEAKPKPQATQ